METDRKDARGEMLAGERFDFGANWTSFLGELDEQRILDAERSLKSLLEVETLAGKSFLDVGSGSGLFSLAARRLGASVRSLDFDPRCVRCAEELRKRYFPDGLGWQIGQGSILDEPFVDGLGQFDIVYSWGVLHHTGEMWRAISIIRRLVGPRGLLAIAIYNDQGALSRYWLAEKRLYNRSAFWRAAMIALHFVPWYLLSILVGLLRGSSRQRGMRRWHDYLDWIGGLPFETATPRRVLESFKNELELRSLRTVGGRSSCNEYVFQRR